MQWLKCSPLCWIGVIAGPMLFALAVKAQTAKEKSTTQSVDQTSSSSPIVALLTTAQECFDTGRYELADKRYRQVLALDPDNDVAALGREQVRKAKEQRAKQPAEVRQPEYALLSAPPPAIDQEPDPAVVQHKLASIIIPSFEVYGMRLKDVLELLHKQAVMYDTDTDASVRGVKIALDLSAPKPPQPPQTRYQPENAIPGLPPGAEQAVADPVVDTLTDGDTRLTLRLAHMPLGIVLDYVAKTVRLRLKIGPRSVSIVPLYDNADELATLEIPIPPSFIEPAPESIQAPAEPDSTRDRVPSQPRIDAKHFLESSGVTFPPGASAMYMRATSKLVIRNTQANLDLVQAIVGEVAPPTASPMPVQ